MELCDCIKSLNLSDSIKKEELYKYPCLEVAIEKEIFIDKDDKTEEFINKDKLTLILFRAIQELKNEIDILKAN